ncbi:phage/plasmid primase, P4 family [Planococcus rifietoensis]|uniref:phage/plasmid primase, P4 family n=1 Tax=Planococcus rifietoensis TaxID=200991 RepID=UPI00384DA4AE
MVMGIKSEINLPDTQKIPEEMKRIPQWVGWKAFPKADGKITKKPYKLDGKYQASFHNHHTFEEVVASCEAGNVDGIGFAMGGAAAYICIDLDADSLDEIPDSLKAVANHSYAELSPSGNGIHIWFKGEWPGDKSSRGKEIRRTKEGYKVEVYYETGYLTMTGNALNDLDIEESQEVIDHIYNMTVGEEKATPSANIQQLNKPELEDESVLKKLLASKSNRELFTDGDISRFDFDHSKADFALCKGLARLSGDAEQIERLFQQSALYRGEPEKHKTYPARTVAKAMLNVATEEAVKLAEREKELDEFSVIPQEETDPGSNYFGGPKGNTFIPKWLGDDIIEDYPLFFNGTHLYLYKDGVYHRDQGGLVGRMVVEKLGDMYKKNHLAETLSYLQNKRWIKAEKVDTSTSLINVRNGLLEWKTGVLHPHSPKHLSTIQLPIDYNPAAKAPNTEKFFRDIVPSDTVPTLFEWLGYSSIPSTRYEKAVILTGSASNGKSKFLELYERFIGKDNTSNVTLQDLEHNRFKLAQLQGKLANVYADISSQAMEKTSVFKTVVSGDRVSAEFKGKDSFDFKPFARLTFSANELPKSRDLTDGYFRRLIIVDFPNTFGKNGLRKDPHILDKITTDEELSGLLNMALEGLKRLSQNGEFTENESTLKAIEEYRRNIDPLISFLDEECYLEEEANVDKQELYDAYKLWALNAGVKPLGKIRFYDRIEKEAKAVEYRPDPKTKRKFKGLGLLETDIFS